MTRRIGDTYPGVERDGALLLEGAERINFGPNVAVVDDGDRTATVTAVGPRTVVTPMTDLADTDFLTVRVKVPSGKTLELYEAGVQADDNSVPVGLTFELDTESAGTVDANEASLNTDHATGSPLATVAGGKTAAFRVENDTGGAIGAGIFAQYRVV